MAAGEPLLCAATFALESGPHILAEPRYSHPPLLVEASPWARLRSLLLRILVDQVDQGCGLPPINRCAACRFGIDGRGVCIGCRCQRHSCVYRRPRAGQAERGVGQRIAEPADLPLQGGDPRRQRLQRVAIRAEPGNTFQFPCRVPLRGGSSADKALADAPVPALAGAEQ